MNLRATYLVALWMMQVQLLLQIMANRIAIIMVNDRKVRYLKWAMAMVVTLLNISGMLTHHVHQHAVLLTMYTSVLNLDCGPTPNLTQTYRDQCSLGSH